MTPINRAQREALKRVHDRVNLYQFDGEPKHYSADAEWPTYTHAHRVTYREFRRTVRPGPDCIMVPWIGMWLGIEPDGYTHS